MTPSHYQLVRLPNGAVSIRSNADGETMHPAIGPAAEAEQLYVKQLRIVERLVAHTGEFVVWDVGLGAAANAVAVLNAASHACGAPASDPAKRSLSCEGATPPKQLQIVSFDHSIEPLQFASQHAAELGYLRGREQLINDLLTHGEVVFRENDLPVNWRVQVGDFPSLLAKGCRTHEAAAEIHSPQSAIRNRNKPSVTASRQAQTYLPAPHVILFDPFSPAKNPAMWTAPLFVDLFRWLDPERPCALATYSRSTMIRVALLLAGFFVGTGHPTGLKEETTLAANRLELLEAPLDHRWLERARRSDAAEPMWDAVYRKARLSAETWERLPGLRQFNGLGRGSSG